MSGKDKTLFRSPGSTRHFLFSKTDTGRLRNAKTSTIIGFDEEFKSVFPDMPVGRLFIDQARQRLDSIAQFAAMVIRLDQIGQDDEKHINPGAVDGLVEVVAILDTVCRIEDGLWGTLEAGLFGSFFPEKNGTQNLDIARKVQNRLVKKTKQTVTIGVASYPTLTYHKAEIIDNARKALDHATFLGPNSAVVFDGVSLNISGDKLYEKGKIQQAIEELEKALMLEPSNVNVHNSLGVCYGLQGNYEQAIEKYKAAVSLDPKEHMAFYNLGLVYLLTERRDQALEFFLHAGEINGDVYEVAFQTGKLYLELGNPEKGRPFLEHAAELEPESGMVYRYLGDCYSAAHLPDAAISAYKKAIKQNPHDAASISALGCLFNDQGENPEIALMFGRESVELSPQNGLFRYRLGRLYSSQNRPDEALKEFKKATSLDYDAAKDIREIKKRFAEKSS